MSPSEFQLRSALRDGEGEHVDPDTVIARARGMQQERHDRRIRYASMAAAVTVIGGIGVVAGVALRGGGKANSGSAAGNEDSAVVRNGAAAPAKGATAAAAPGAMADARAVPCPTTAPHLALPGGGSGQFGAHGPLFSGPVAAVKVCAYPGDGPVTRATSPSRELAGQDAAALATSLDAAATNPPAGHCAGAPTTDEVSTLVVIAISTTGQAMPPVVVTLSCPGTVTNGTALRYGWRPPPDLVNRLPRVGGSGATSIGPTVKATRSPLPS
ncbi:MAG: hypothetical protein ABR604_08935 [Jatrophihabitantaceae bacterium]